MFEGCVYFNLNAVTRQVNRVAEEAFAPTGLSPPHGYLMRLVLAEPGIGAKAAAAQLKLAPSTVTRFADVLVTRGLLERGRGEDGREVRLTPTAKGEALAPAVNAAARTLYTTLRKRLGAGGFDQLLGQLHTAQDKLGGEDG